MKTTTQNQPDPFNSIAASASAGRAASGSDQSVVDKVSAVVDKVSDVAQVVREQVEECSAEALHHAKEKVGQVYDRANRGLNEQYERAIGYGRENPGKTTLIALGIGVGVGLLVAGSFNSPSFRRRRMVGPIMNTLSTIADELLR